MNHLKQIRLFKVVGILMIMFLSLLLSAYFYVPKKLFSSPLSVVVNDREGGLLSARIASDGQWRFPETDSLPSKYKTCLLQFEDRNFYHHFGVDFIAIVRAMVSNLKHGHVVQGGSTLTMQLARMALGNRPRTAWNKILEVYYALGIELNFSKEEILRLYASNAPFGGNIVGLDAAAWRYFHRDASTLSWAEAATLAVLPNSPSLIHLNKNRELLQRKRDMLLNALGDRGFLPNEEVQLSMAENLTGATYALPNDAPHYLDFVSRLGVVEHHSSLDPRLQRMVQRMVNDCATRYRSSNHIDNMAALVLDVETGKPIAYVGNVTTPGVEASYVDVIQCERSPGSLLKPFLYAAMMTCGELTPRQLISDTPLSINGFTPSNYSHSFSGAVHADEAIMQSLNVPLVRMLSTHSVGRFMEDLKSLGMTTLHYDEDHYGASLILGGAEAKLYDLCGMYRNMAFRLLHTEHPDPEERISRAAIWHTFVAMSKLNRPEEESGWQQFRSMKKVAWKTGTSWGHRDAWAIGVTTKYVVGVWVGNATGEGRAGMTGVGFAAPVMFDIFSLLSNSEWFAMPYDGMGSFAICQKSGCLASESCQYVDTVMIPKRAEEMLACSYCRKVHLSKDERWQVNSSCFPVDEMVEKLWFVLPPAQEYYFMKSHADYKKLPLYHPDCEGASLEQVDFIYPEHNSVVVLPRGFDGNQEQVVFKAVVRKQGSELFWHLDNEFMGKTIDDHQMSMLPEKGVHTLSIVDDEGHRRAISFTVK